MIIFGHPWIKSPKFRKVFKQSDIEKSGADEILLLEPLVDSHELARHCAANELPFAVTVNSLKDAIFANAIGADYIVCEEDDAMVIQPIAENYLFDTKVLALIFDEKEISKIARSNIDGVIFPEAIV